ncbi:MAG: ABC transporter permease subunit [Microlunatus sp.]|nr:ABC transporter permease subunit [Microlunatus sp.]
MIAFEGAGLPGFHRVLIWFNDPANWPGPDGLLTRIAEHAAYTAIIMAISVAIAIPLGTWMGHTGRGILLVGGLANAIRAVPTLGLLILLIVDLAPKINITAGLGWILPPGSIPYLMPIIIVLIILALPPIITSTYAGIQGVDSAARDAARGTGMTELQIAVRLEFPCALPLVFGGIRSATLQVIATLTIAAYGPLVGGLGRIILDGQNRLTDLRYGYPAMVAAGLTIAAMAICADSILALMQRLVVSPGVSGRPA